MAAGRGPRGNYLRDGPYGAAAAPPVGHARAHGPKRPIRTAPGHTCGLGVAPPPTGDAGTFFSL